MTQTLQVSPENARGRLDGFGVSGCWWAQALGRWPDEALDVALDLLFDPVRGIGLTQYRHNLGGGAGTEISDPWRRSETMECAAGHYDFSRDAAAQRVLRAVCDRGVSDVVLFANSPPGRMTHSGSATGSFSGESNLRRDMVAAFARYLVELTRHFCEAGLPVKHLSPINEPQWDWQQRKGQEGCHYEPDECVALTREVLKGLERARLQVDVSVVDAGEWKTAGRYADALMADPYIAQRLNHFAVHSYWSEAADKSALAAYLQERYPQLELWMSEWTEMRAGRDSGMASALTLAETVHDDLTLGQVTRWQYWIGVSKYDFCDGLIYVDEAPPRISETKRLWALGNYSRFIKPGSVQVVVSSPAELKASAYLDPSHQTLTLVIINSEASEQVIGWELGGHFRTFTRYETSEHRSLARVSSGDVGELTRLPPKSVSTLVFEKGVANVS